MGLDAFEDDCSFWLLFWSLEKVRFNALYFFLELLVFYKGDFLFPFDNLILLPAPYA
jgi:hypothetical protein